MRAARIFALRWSAAAEEFWRRSEPPVDSTATGLLSSAEPMSFSQQSRRQRRDPALSEQIHSVSFTQIKGRNDEQLGAFLTNGVSLP